MATFPDIPLAEANAIVEDESASEADELLAVFEGAASLWLEWIEEEAGPGSPVLELCREVWRDRVDSARVSIQHDDLGNAAHILNRGLTLLAHGPQILAREELTLAELETLLRGF